MATKKSTSKKTTEATRGGAARGSASSKKTSTPKTSNAEAVRGGAARGTNRSVTSNAKKGFDAGLKSTLGNDPKPYIRVRRTKGNGKPIDTTADGKLATDSSYANRGPRFRSVDHGAAGDLPAGATSAKYDTYTGKFVPVFNSGSKKNSKKDLPRDYGL